MNEIEKAYDEFLKHHFPRGGEKVWTSVDMEQAFQAGIDFITGIITKRLGDINHD